MHGTTVKKKYIRNLVLPVRCPKCFLPFKKKNCILWTLIRKSIQYQILRKCFRLESTHADRRKDVRNLMGSFRDLC